LHPSDRCGAALPRPQPRHPPRQRGRAYNPAPQTLSTPVFTRSRPGRSATPPRGAQT
jgi:hypothetical protein